MLRETYPGEAPMYEEQTFDSWHPVAEYNEPLPAMQIAAPETVRQCQDLARQISASSFSLLFLKPDGDGYRLAPVFDSTFPGISSLSRALSTPFMGEFACQAAMATAPLWWRADKTSFILDADACKWATEVTSPIADAPITSSSAIAFPVAQTHGRIGLVVFSGDGLALDQQQLCEVHARCHALFSEVARQQPLASAAMPSMSRREIECLRLTANGLTSDNIAASLGLSIHTANQYLTAAAQKLNAVNRIHAVAKALRTGLID